jgi:hypothetical protein
MVELSEKLIRPSVGAFTGSLSASSGALGLEFVPPRRCNLAGKFHC